MYDRANCAIIGYAKHLGRYYKQVFNEVEELYPGLPYRKGRRF